MKNYNKKLCVFVVLMLFGAGNNVFSYENITVNDSAPMLEDSQEKIKANKETLSKAQSAIDNKDFISAINYLNGYISSKSGRYEAYKMRGDAYYALRRYDMAQRDYQSAVDIKSNEDKLATNTKYVSAIILGADKNEQLQNTELGNLYASLMYAQKALNDPAYLASYDNAVKYNSHIYLPVQNKSDINRINCPQKYAKQLNPTGVDATIASAISDIEKNDFHSSIFKIQNVINEYPNYYLGYYLMGVALVGVEKEDEAVKSFEKALSLNPYDFESMASLGQIYYDKAETNFSTQDSKKSIDYFTKASEFNKNCPTYYFYIGLNNLNSGDFNSAISNFNRALNINENDYNSLYYKALTQYIIGDYNAVVNITSKLLYKHVSNYNSVLYLRALAYNKLGQNDRALADLDAIDDNVKDVFNMDIKVASKKDKVLLEYAKYVRSQIQNSGNSKTYDGLTNPIIRKLAGVQNSLRPYDSIINSKTITPEDYKKLENLYTVSLPKLLGTGIVVSYDEIDTQYDFIRTTFSDIGVSFVPKTSDTYILTELPNYYKKYERKMYSENLLEPAQYSGIGIIANRELSASGSAQNSSYSKLLQAGESSLAQMLASNVLVKVSEERAKSAQNNPSTQNINVMTTSDVAKVELKSQNSDSENSKSAPIVSSQEPYVPASKQLVNDNNLQKVKDIIKEENSISNGNTGAMVFKAEDVKQTEEFKIYNEKVNKTSGESTNTLVTENGNVKISAKEIKETPDVIVRNVPVAEEGSVKKEEIVQKNTEKVQLPKEESQGSNQTKNQPLQNQSEKLSAQKENPYVKQVYKGLSTAMAESKIGSEKDVVELSVPKDSEQPNVFTNDRLGFAIGAKSANAIFDGSLRPVQEKINQLSVEASENVLKMDEQISDMSKQAQELKDSVTSIETLKENKKELVNDVVVPKLEQSEQNIPIKEEASEKIAKANSTLTSIEEKLKDQSNNTSLLDEYERLLKEKEKNEKLALKEEKRQAKIKAKELKLRAKEEQNIIKQEAKALRAKEKAEQKLINTQEKVQKSAETIETKAAKTVQKSQQQDKTKNFVSKIKNKFKKVEKSTEEKTAQLQAKADKKAQAIQLKEERAKAKLESKERRAKAKAEEKLVSQQKKSEAVSSEVKEQNEKFWSKLRDKFKRTEKTTEEKTARIQARADKKAQAEKLKAQKMQAKSDKKAKDSLEKSVKASQREKANIENKAQKFVKKDKKNVEKRVNSRVEKKETKSFLKKLKFWEKEKKQNNSTSVGRYINNAVKQNPKPSLRF